MKKIITTLCLALGIFVIANAQNTPASMKEILNDAKAVAQQENKNILIYFHASWCKWCKKFEAKLQDENVKDFFNNNFVIRGVDVQENAKNKDLENPGGGKWLISKGYKKTGLPFYVFMDKKGKIIETSLNEAGDNIGFPAKEEELNTFIDKLKKLTAVSSEEEENIRNTFSK